ncbi:carboxylesterase family protein [Schlegelella sp. S2-27]|uniref:Carboxylic ester hydrolase n=1 Tax=Caldimonas mangrovi TaxID=2944811 RepID=A0ABT0YHR0_9BURK|nr:carboxylesterase family protein [Caldimonas mangrovi]MCM5678252.1 carboxylesterase family protein [Caldimonas mangrovi]
MDESPSRAARSRALVYAALLLLTGWLSIGVAHAAYDRSLTRTLDAGQIHGKVDASDTHAFLGIPFAQPPVGELRWRAPQPPAPWGGSRPATTMAPMCAQVGSFFGEPDPATFGHPVGSEDCLYLNVWRPNSTADDLPVFVWLHGGSNLKGTAREPTYNGAYLARKANMVVVTVQYRMGMLGWLNHPAVKTGNALDDSGNFTTLDLVRALDWVQANAGAFGGDRDRVTVAGQSAGCINTWGLLQSPLAAGKFHRALCTSGIPNGYPPVIGHVAANYLIDRLLVDTGRASDLLHAAALRVLMSNTQIAELLRSASAAQIMKFSPAPVVPGHFTDGTVIRRSGLAGLVAGHYNRVPLMIGSTRDEGAYALYLAGMGRPTPQEYWHLANYAPPGTVTYDQLIKPEFQPIYTQTHQVLSYAYGLITDNTLRLMRLTSGPNMLFRYNFDWDDTPAPWKQALGAFHGIDVAFLFGNFVTDQPHVMRFAWTSANESASRALSDRFIRHVASFARYGRPSRLFDGQTYWNDWTNFTWGDKRMVLDNRSYMSSDDHLFFWPRYSLLSAEQKEFIRKAIDFDALPANVDPFRGGMR